MDAPDDRQTGHEVVIISADFKINHPWPITKSVPRLGKEQCMKYDCMVVGGGVILVAETWICAPRRMSTKQQLPPFAEADAFRAVQPDRPD
jgi:hypothetical protein